MSIGRNERGEARSDRRWLAPARTGSARENRRALSTRPARPSGAAPGTSIPSIGPVSPVIRDHQRVVAAVETGAPGPHRLAERLDAEILPRLERPGRQVGPFDPRVGAPDGPSRLVLIWPSVAEGQAIPAALEPLLPSERTRRHDLSLACAPAADLRRALSACALPLSSRPDAWALRDHPLWLVWLERPLQLFGLLSIFRSAAVAPRAIQRQGAPRVVVAGPAVAGLRALLAVYADDLLATGTLDPAHVERLAAGEPVASVLGALDAWQRGGQDAPGPVPDPAATDECGTEIEAPFRPDPAEHRLLRAEQLAAAAVETLPPGRGGAPRRRIRLSSASAALREARWAVAGVDPDQATAAQKQAAREVFESPAGQLEIEVAYGLPGETAADRLALSSLIDQWTAVAPRGAKQLRIRLRAYLPNADERAAGHRPIAPGVFAAALESALALRRQRRVRVDAAPAAAALCSAWLEELGPAAAQFVEAVHAAGACEGESPLALDPALWISRQADHGVELPWIELTEAGEADAEPAPTGFESGLPRVEVPDPGFTPARPRGHRPTRWERWSGLVPRQFDYRIEYARRRSLRFLTAGEITELFLAAFERAGIEMATTGVVQPRPKLVFGPSLSVGIEGVREYVDVALLRKCDDLGRRLKRELPPEFELRACRFVPIHGQSTSLSSVALAEYRCRLGPELFEDPEAHRETLARLRQWQSRLSAGSSCGDGEADPLHQIREIDVESAATDEPCVRFVLDLRVEGAKCKPREVLERALAGSTVDPRCVPLMRTRLLALVDENGRVRRRTPLEAVDDAERRLRARTKRCA